LFIYKTILKTGSRLNEVLIRLR